MRAEASSPVASTVYDIARAASVSTTTVPRASWPLLHVSRSSEMTVYLVQGRGDGPGSR